MSIMKNIIRISAAALTALFTVSCAGFLDENPTTSLSESTVYNSEISLEAQVYDIYMGFCTSSGHMGNVDEFLHSASGLIHWKSNRLGQVNWTDALKFTQNANSSNARPFYSEHYTNINRCNRLLDNLPGSPVDPAYKREIEAEVKMLRALNYYYIVRLYGDLPLILTSPKSVADCSNPRTPFWKVYKQILDDLTFAEENMRDEARVAATTGTAGSRPHKMAATALKAHVYMTIGSLLSNPDDNFWDTSKRTPDFSECGINSAKDAWQLCYDTCNKVIASHTYELAPTYKRLFRWSDPSDFTLKERIITFTSSNQIKYCNLSTRSLPEYPVGTKNTTTKNLNFGRWHPDRWTFQKWCETYGGEKGTSENNSNIYIRCNDPRLAISLYYSSYKRQPNGNVSTAYMYPSNSRIFDTGAYSHPLYKKYLDPTFDVTSGNCSLYVLRYAEIFLIAAEAAVELSEAVGDEKWQEAYDFVEVVHERARKSVGAAVEPVEDVEQQSEQPKWEYDRFSTKEEFIEGIFWERFFELGGEEHEFYDTHRRGANFLVNVVAKPKNIFLQQPEQGDYIDSSGNLKTGYRSYYYGPDFLYSEDAQELRKSLALPIPMEEYSYNSALDQTKDLNDFHWN